MSSGTSPDSNPKVQHIFAHVTLRPPFDRRELDSLQEKLDAARFERILQSRDDPDRLDLLVRLAAELASGERISREQADMGLGLRRRGVAAIYHRYHGPPIPAGCDEDEYLMENYRVGIADIEDAINQLLGRDPEQHRPPRLTWEGMIGTLGRAGISVTEEQLIALPLTVELDREVQRTLDSL